MLGETKQLAQTTGLAVDGGDPVAGYEMHMGETKGPDTARPMVRLKQGPDGARSADGRVMGSYLHGLFASDPFRHRFLNQLRHRAHSGIAFEAVVEETLDALGAHLEAHLDLDALLGLARAR